MTQTKRVIAVLVCACVVGAIVLMFDFFGAGTKAKGYFIGHNLQTYLECKEELQFKGVSQLKSKELCIDKYSYKLKDTKYAHNSNGTASKLGAITVTISNDSLALVFKKISYRGYYECKDESVCERGYFRGEKYINIEPNSNADFNLAGEFNIPTDVKSGEWNWGLSGLDYYVFNLDY